MLLNDGIFFDDWRYFQQKDENLINIFRLEGWYYTGIWAIHVYLFAFKNHTLIYHVLAIIGGGINLVLFYKILRNSSFGIEFAKVASLIYAVSPFFFMKNTANTFPYILCVMFFLLGYLLLILNQKSKKPIYNILGSVLIFISFITTSIIMLFPILLLHLFSQMKFKLFDFIKKYYWLFLIPLAFLAVRQAFLLPIEGSSSKDYNRIKVENIQKIPQIAFSLNIHYAKYMFVQVRNYWLIFALIFLVSSSILLKMKLKIISFNASFLKNIQLILLGVTLFFLAIIPYILVNKYPEFTSLNTRHQLLIPFGITLGLTGIVLLIKHPIFKSLVLGFVLSVFITNVLAQTVIYYKGWIKYELIGGFFKNNTIISGSTLIIEDDKNCFYPSDRAILYFELAGVYKKFTGKQDIFFVGVNQNRLNKQELEQWLENRKKNNLLGSMNMSDFEKIKNIRTIKIHCNKPMNCLDILNFVRTYYLEGSKSVYKKYSNFLKITVKEVT